MKLVNYTPHSVSIHTGSDVITLEPAGPAPRLSVNREILPSVNGIPLVRSSMGDPEGMPEPQEDTLLIVSALVAEHPSLENRADLVYPGEAIRQDGIIIGCKGLCAGPGLARKMGAEPAYKPGMRVECGMGPGTLIEKLGDPGPHPGYEGTVQVWAVFLHKWHEAAWHIQQISHPSTQP